MLAMLLVLMVAVGNFALGFGLALYMGHGPAAGSVPFIDNVRTRLRHVLRLGGST